MATSSPLTATSSKEVANPDTGFHEPFSEERNTTLRHPEATVGAGEELKTEIIDASTSKKRHLFLAKRRGQKVDGADEAMDGDVQYADGDEAGENGIHDDEKHEGFFKRNIHKVEEKLHLRKPSSS